MSIWEKMGFGGYKGFSHEADRLLRSAVELAGNLGCEKADTSHLLRPDPAAGSGRSSAVSDRQTDL